LTTCVITCPAGCKRCDGNASCDLCHPGKYLRFGVCTEYAELFFDDFEAGTTTVNGVKWVGENNSSIYCQQ